MKIVCLIFGVFLLVAIPVSGTGWDDPFHDSTQRPSQGSTERRTPGWLTRARHEHAAAELAGADALRAAGRWRAAARRYRAVVANWPDADEAVAAQLRLAELLEQRRRHQKAFNEYQYLIVHYSGRFSLLPVLERQYALSTELATGRRGQQRVRRRPDEARIMLETLLKNAPQWEKAPAIQFMIADLHEDADDLELAASAYVVVQRRYPGTLEAQAAAFREVRCMTRLARGRPHDEALTAETLMLLRRFLAQAPAGIERHRAEDYFEEMRSRKIQFWRDRADYYDRIRHRPAAALIVYEEWLSRFPEMEDAASIRKRMEFLRREMAQP